MRKLWVGIVLFFFVVGCSHAPRETGSHAAPAGDPWEALREGNQRFVAGPLLHHDLGLLRKALVEGQHPRAIVLTCSDSRVAPEIVFDATLGEVFVVRVAGNVIDPVVLGSIEYGVEHLHAGLIVVLGHEKCGAVAAATSGEKMPSANLDALVSRIAPALVGLPKEADALAAVEANVRRVGQELLAGSPILAKEVEEGKVHLVLAVYRLGSGEVVPLAP